MTRRSLAILAACAALASVAMVPDAAQARPALSPAKINGSGSTYVALAMQQWVADAQTDGLQINYLPTGSPQGLTSFSQSLTDFAGTEAEYSALGVGVGEGGRGYQYVPDVAGAVSVMYNVNDQAGRKIDYLRLSRSTVARIFMGDISRWSDPAITADNKGLVLPDQPITVVYRGGQSGTTALFYDFVAHTEPSKFAAWAAKYKLPTQVRIIQLDGTPDFAPKTQALNGSDQIAQFVASSQGRWAIAYDEFGYAVTYGAEAARIENQSGEFVLPFAENISAALESAKLRSDLSQDLTGVYASGNPLAYPISAYSYMVTQCTKDPARATCQGPYTNSGVGETLATWMRYIACEGQVNMAAAGYSPLPPNLSQEVANSIGRMLGAAPEQLTGSNCANPRFKGSLGSGAESPPDPIADIPSLAGGQAVAGGGIKGDGAAVSSSPTSGAAATAQAGAGAGASQGSGSQAGAGATATGAVGRSGTAAAIGGGSSIWRDAVPAAYHRGRDTVTSPLVALLLLLVVGGPAAGLLVVSTLRRRSGGPPTSV